MKTYVIDLSNYITDNTLQTSDLLKTSVEEGIFSFLLIWFLFMFSHSITDYMVPHDLHRTLYSISKDFSIPRVVIYLLQSLDSFGTNI